MNEIQTHLPMIIRVHKHPWSVRCDKTGCTNSPTLGIQLEANTDEHYSACKEHYLELLKFWIDQIP